MNARASKSIEVYNEQAEALSKIYNKLATVDVLPCIETVLPVKRGDIPQRALDIGCGSGRDAFWLASRGFAVVGVDAAIQMIAQARKTNRFSGKAVYLVDTAPELARVRNRNEKFDFFLMSASWMHFNSRERKGLIALMHDLSTRNATAYISLRHGPSPDDRPMFQTSVEEVRALAESSGAMFKTLPAVGDRQGRNDVTWDYVALQFRPTRIHPAFRPEIAVK